MLSETAFLCIKEEGVLIMKEIFIERQKQILRIAIKEDNKLKECFIEEEIDEPMPGQIYKGKVQNIVPAIKSAFIDIGYEKNCYMYLDSKFNNTKLKKNEDIIVEVMKEDIGNKGAKVTNAFSIAGRYVVLETLHKDVKFSKKLYEEEIKSHIKENINKPEDVGITVRTNAASASIEHINEEIDKLYEIYKSILKDSRYSLKPKLLYSDEGIIDRILRDNLDENTHKIVVDNKKDYDYINEFIKNQTDIKTSIEIYEAARTLLSFEGIEKEIEKLRNNKVFLKCGGYIIIDKTEAMYVIDVNSGKNIKNNSMRDTVLKTNLEAAEEIARQIILRNLSGIILVDFIDMDNQEDKVAVMQALTTGFEKDKNKTVIYPFTELNLVQIARRRRGKTIYEYMEESCSSCKGRGKRFRLSYLNQCMRNEVLKIDREQGIQDIYIELGKSYKKEVMDDLVQWQFKPIRFPTFFVGFVPGRPENQRHCAVTGDYAHGFGGKGLVAPEIAKGDDRLVFARHLFKGGEGVVGDMGFAFAKINIGSGICSVGGHGQSQRTLWRAGCRRCFFFRFLLFSAA